MLVGVVSGVAFVHAVREETAVAVINAAMIAFLNIMVSVAFFVCLGKYIMFV